jgi:hypothetical protein
MNLRMSDIATAQRCLKKFHYRYVRGWESKTEPGTWREGTWIHQWLKSFYVRTWAEMAASPGKLLSTPEFFEPKPPEDLTDMERFVNAEAIVRYYWEQSGQYDKFDEIISVEQPIKFQLGEHTITDTYDLVVRQGGRIRVYDHKTVGSIPDTLAFLGLDVQLWTYLLSIKELYGEEADFVYNIIRRKVPPPPESKSRASRDVGDYLKRVRVWKSSEELAAYKQELLGIVNSLDAGIHIAGLWPRTPIKNGGEACQFCPYLSVCAAELAGQVVDDGTAGLLYNVNPAH